MTGTESDNAVISALLPPGYAMLHDPRGSRGGGTAIVHRSCISVRPSNARAAFTTFELQDCTVMAAHPVRVCNVYRSQTNGGKSMAEFFTEFANLLESLAVHGGHAILVGDLNFHINNPNDRDANELKILLSSLSLKQHVQGPTHRSGNTLDLVITREDGNLVTSAIATDHGFRDHFPIFVSTSIKKPADQKKTVSFRKIKALSADALNEALSHSNICRPIAHHSLADLISLYNDELTQVLNDLAPLKTRTITYRPDTEWYNDAIRQAKQQRRRAERKWRSTGLHVDREVFIEQRDHVNQMIEDAKQNHYRDQVNGCEDLKQLFKIVNKLLGKKTDAVLPSKISVSSLAQRFNEFFIEKIVKIRESIGQCNDPTPEGLSVLCTMTSFSQVSVEYVGKLISSASNKSCDLDPMPTELVKMGARHIAPIITRLINLSLSQGTFPTELKTAVVRPSLKKPRLDAEELVNYRPIANLPLISKLIEKTAVAQLNDYLSANELLEENQSAYPANHSTETALLHVYDNIIRSIGDKKAVLFVMIDLSAAFDTIDFEILQGTLQQLGIRDTAAAWFHSYMQHRMQCVKIENEKSTPHELTQGIPQGSVLGPILFTLYMTSLGRVLRHHGVRYHCYADDTQLWIPFAPHQLADAIQSMEACLNDVQKWMLHFKLKMNCSKTEYMVIATPRIARDHDFQRVISVCGAEIAPLSSAVRNLGVHMASDLSLDTHVSLLSRVCFAQLRSISRVKRYLDQATLEKVVHAFVTSKLDYCNSLLLGAPAKIMARVQRIQNAAARIVSGTPIHHHITPVLRELHWLSVEKRVMYKVLLIAFKIIHGPCPSYLNVLTLRDATQSRTLRQSNSNMLDVAFTSSSFVYQRSFTYAAPRMWNSLPSNLRCCDELNAFKARLKTYLFN